jgi:hypothetical protein
VAVGKRANPDVSPGRRDCQSPDPFQHLRLGELRPVGPSVCERFSCLLAPYARTGIRDISQARRFGGVLGINNYLRYPPNRLTNRSPPSAISNEPSSNLVPQKVPMTPGAISARHRYCCDAKRQSVS